MKRKTGVKLFDFVMDFLAFLAGLLLLLVTLFVSYAVVVRYLHFKPPVWVLQFTEYALLWITFLGAAWLLREGGHIKLDTLVSRLNPKRRRTLTVITDILGFIVSFIIFWFGTLHTIDLYRRAILDVKGVSVPKFALFLIIPIGGLTLLIQFGRHFFKQLRSKQFSEENSADKHSKTPH